MQTGNGKARVTVTLGLGVVVWAVACSGGPQSGGWFHGSSGGGNGSSGGEGDSGDGDDSGSSSGFSGSSSGFGGSSGGSSGSSGGAAGSYVSGVAISNVGLGPRAGSVSGCGGSGECPCSDNGDLYCGLCSSHSLPCVYCPSGDYCPSDVCTTATAACPPPGSNGYVCPSSAPNSCNDEFCCPTGYSVCCTTGAYCATESSACPP